MKAEPSKQGKRLFVVGFVFFLGGGGGGVGAPCLCSSEDLFLLIYHWFSSHPPKMVLVFCKIYEFQCGIPLESGLWT